MGAVSDACIEVLGWIVYIAFGSALCFQALVTIACLVLLAVAMCIFDLAWTTRVIVFAGSSYVLLLSLFGIMGMLTLVSTVSTPLNLARFWSYKGWRGLFAFKNWQAMGFILRPFGLLIVGGMLFATKNVVVEGIMSGDDLPQDRRCYFEYQTPLERALVMGGVKGPLSSNITVDDRLAAVSKCGVADVTCQASFLNIPVYRTTPSLWQALVVSSNFMVQGRSPSDECFGADRIVTFPLLTIPTADFSPGRVTEQHVDYAPAYFGHSGLLWWTKFYYTEHLQTPCNYACTKAAEATPVDFVMNLGMIFGGGLAIVLVANELGKYIGTSFVTPDTSLVALRSRSLGDIRILLPILWTDNVRLYSKPYVFTVLIRVGLLWLKFTVAIISIRSFNEYMDSYAPKYADRAVLQCIYWLGIWVVLLRSCFIFTEKVWQDGEESHVVVNAESGMVPTTIDLYGWLRLSRKQLMEHLIFYVRRVGPAELNSKEPIPVAAIIQIKVRDDNTNILIPARSKGIIQKQDDGGVIWEGRNVLVQWEGSLPTCAVDPVMLMQAEGQWNEVDAVKELASTGTTPHEFFERKAAEATASSGKTFRAAVQNMQATAMHIGAGFKNKNTPFHSTMRKLMHQAPPSVQARTCDVEAGETIPCDTELGNPKTSPNTRAGFICKYTPFGSAVRKLVHQAPASSQARTCDLETGETIPRDTELGNPKASSTDSDEIASSIVPGSCQSKCVPKKKNALMTASRSKSKANSLVSKEIATSHAVACSESNAAPKKKSAAVKALQSKSKGTFTDSEGIAASTALACSESKVPPLHLSAVKALSSKSRKLFNRQTTAANEETFDWPARAID